MGGHILFLLNGFPMKLWTLALLMTCTSCIPTESYLCKSGDGKRKFLISWNPTSVFISHSTFSILRNEPLDDDSPGGSSNVGIDRWKIVASVVQDTSSQKLERPSGEIVPIDQKKLYEDIESRGYATSFHAIVPVRISYVFDRRKNAFEVLRQSLPPRMADRPGYSWIKAPSVREHRYNTETKRAYQKKIGTLDEARAEKAYPPTRGRSSYPDCRRKNIAEAALAHWTSTFMFP